MLIKNVSLLHGRELDYILNTKVRISANRIAAIGKDLVPKKGEEIIECEGLLMMPGLVNSHTHIGDSIGKDVGIDSDVESKIHPVTGFKQKILEKSQVSHLSSFIRNSCVSMLKKGITTFIDFREGGLDGVGLLKNSIHGIPIRAVILGRINYYQDLKSIKNNTSLPVKQKAELQRLLKSCDGLGISGPNEFGDSVLQHFSKQKKIRAIHSAETRKSEIISNKITGKTETRRALLVKPDFLVHMTYASKKDLQLASKNKISIAVCPRANGALAEGIPNVNTMIEAGCNVVIGTDNVMVNSPDMFREMDYLWKASMGLNTKRISPKSILKMATSNVSSILDNKIGMIQTNGIADCIFIEKHAIDIEPMYNPYAAIVHRASENSIRAVMYGGKIVHGKI